MSSLELAEARANTAHTAPELDQTGRRKYPVDVLGSLSSYFTIKTAHDAQSAMASAR